MIDKIRNINPFQERKYAVIGITIDDVPDYEVLIVNKDSEELSIVSSFRTKDYVIVKEKVDANIPVLFNFSGNGIINKKVVSQGNYIKEVLFNAPLEEFYIFETHQHEFEFVSIARKKVLDNFFSQFKKDKYLVIDYSIGPFIGILLKTILNKSSFVSGDCELIFENELLIDYRKNSNLDEKHVLGKEKINNIQVLLFATLLSHLYPSEDMDYERDFLLKNEQELKFKKIFNSTLVFVGVFFLVSLLISYLLLNHFNNKCVTYASQLYNLEHTYDQVKKLEIEKQNKTLILQESGILNQNFLSYYLYDIVSTIPGNISLNSIRINPVLNKVKDLEKIQFETNSILIQGNSQSSLPVNIWVKNLKLEKWILKIEILDFSKNKEQIGQFTLKIIIK